MYNVLKYSVLICNLLLTILLLIGNNVKDFPDPKEAKKVVNAAWITAVLLVLNSALILVN